MIRRDPIFKGCTRPAMLWGVPITPLIICFGAITLLGLWTNLLLLALFVPAYLVMRLVVRNDDQQFRLLWLKARCRLIARDRNARFWRASAYAPHRFTRRP